MNIFIRAYGSHLMGMGHLYRVEKLVKRLRERSDDLEITLFTQKYEEAIEIYKKIDIDNLIEVSSTLTESEELKYLEDIIKKNSYDFCINDQLNTDKSIASLLISNVKKSITFDDLGDGNYLFNHIINVLYPSKEQLDNEINSYEYMILNDFSKIKEKINFSKEIKKIFINQGAADTWGAIPDMIEDLNKIESNIIIKVLLGPSFQHFEELSKALEKNKKQIEIFNFTDNVVELVKDCDLAILGAGNTLFEVASLGIPIIASTREEKELTTIQRLLNDSVVYAENKIYKSCLKNIVQTVINDMERREIMYQQNRKLFSYNGLNNIVDLLIGNKK